MDGSLVGTTGLCKHGMDIGYDGMPKGVGVAERVPQLAWKPLQRPRHEPKTDTTRRKARPRRFDTLRLQCDQVAEFNYQPTAYTRTYRMSVVRKNISNEKGLHPSLW